MSVGCERYAVTASPMSLGVVNAEESPPPHRGV